MVNAPDFKLLDQNGLPHSLADYKGKWLIIYFYPKDDTPSCTTEACNFRDGREVLQNMGSNVVGISKDTVKSHAKFAKKHNLDFTLLSDPDHNVIQAFGSWQLKKFMGREYMGTMRDTYLINPQGKIYKKYAGVDPKIHIAELLADLKATKA